MPDRKNGINLIPSRYHWDQLDAKVIVLDINFPVRWASKLLVHFIWPGIKNKLATDLKMWMNHTLEDTCPSSRSPRCNAGLSPKNTLKSQI
jgi:hypothetical protein